MTSTRKRASNGSNGHGVPATVVISPAPSTNGSRTHDTVSASVALGVELQTAHAEVLDGVVATDALERALRYVPHTSIGVVGSRPGVMVNWLRRNQHDAESLTLQEHARTPVIVAADLPEVGADGSEFFGAIRRALTPDGLLIAIVPNLTHARVRIAMLLGRYSARSNGRIPSFTIGDLERMLHDAAFTIIDVERQVDTVDAVKTMGEGVPESVVNMLATDLDAMTSHFVVLAEPDQSPGAGRCHRRINEIADSQRKMAREADRIEGRVAQIEVRVQHWATETNRLALHEATTPDAGPNEGADRLERELRTVSERLAASRSSETERDGTLNQAREQLVKRTGELRALATRIERARYRREVLRITQAVNRVVPRGSIVAVVSRGDDELLTFEGRPGWHFPRTDKGVYAGHHPADSTAAIRHVEELRARGARYLVIPRTAFWWLEHYKEFGEYLERRGRCAWRDERTCALFELGRARAAR